MHVSDPHLSRRGAFLLIALFSCLQILFGFFLITGNEQDNYAQTLESPTVTASFEASEQTAFFAALKERQR